jgi:hypothetical protein
MNNEKIIELREKILKGIELSFEKLLQAKQKNGGQLVYSKGDKILFVQADKLVK